MPPRDDVTAWAMALVRRRMGALAAVRAKARRRWKAGRHVHELRTNARRLRAAVEDLRTRVPGAQALIDASKELGKRTGKVRDAHVLIDKLQHYRHFALPAERSEIDVICRDLRKAGKAAQKSAQAAVADARLELRW